jgi:mannose-6-phosphate isomerase
MIEIMEPTDLVVRIEFEKAGYVLPEEARFMNRGIDFAISMIDFTPLPIETIQSNYFISERLSGDYGTAKEFEIFGKTITDCFRMNKLEVKGKFSLKKESFYIVIVTDGFGGIKSGGETYHVKYGDKFFIPASAEMVQFNTESSLEVILAMPPE